MFASAAPHYFTSCSHTSSRRLNLRFGLIVPVSCLELTGCHVGIARGCPMTSRIGHPFSNSFHLFLVPNGVTFRTPEADRKNLNSLLALQPTHQHFFPRLLLCFPSSLQVETTAARCTRSATTTPPEVSQPTSLPSSVPWATSATLWKSCLLRLCPSSRARSPVQRCSISNTHLMLSFI